jgi:hypothetical protein
MSRSSRRWGRTGRRGEAVARAIRIVNFAALAKTVASAVRRRSRGVPARPAALAGVAAAAAAALAVVRRRRRAAALEPLEDSRLDEPPAGEPGAEPERTRRFVPGGESAATSGGTNGADEDEG